MNKDKILNILQERQKSSELAANDYLKNVRSCLELDKNHLHYFGRREGEAIAYQYAIDLLNKEE